MRDALKIYLPITALIIGGFVFTWQFVEPAPPTTITIATGMKGGSYAGYVDRYKNILARSGVTVKIRHTAGAKENIDLLTNTNSGVDVAFIQGGIGDPYGAPNLRSIASIFFEPVWVLARGNEPLRYLGTLKGKRIAIGATGSGSKVLAKILLTANDVDDENSTFVYIGGNAAAKALKERKVDAAFFVSAILSKDLVALIREPDIQLMDFSHADAYQRQFKYLSQIKLPEGVLDLAANLPPRPLSLVAPTAALVTTEDLHPALIDLLLGASTEIHANGNLTTPAAMFPSANFIDFPLSADAKRFLKSGPTFLRRVLPFWAAIRVERLAIFLLPLITLMIPLFKLAPPAYRWGIRRKINRAYKELRQVEVDWRERIEDADPTSFTRRLDDIQIQVGKLHLPISHAEQLYQLRFHIRFVRGLITGEQVPAT